MIHYALICENKHEFEVWFASSEDCDRQRARKLVACPVCGSTAVDRAIMAPAIANAGRRKGEPDLPGNAAASEAMAMISSQERQLRAKLREMRDHLTKNADNVGEKFPEEARKMHYGETEHRSIYGQASAEEASLLQEEGIPVYPLPVLPDEKN